MWTESCKRLPADFPFKCSKSLLWCTPQPCWGIVFSCRPVFSSPAVLLLGSAVKGSVMLLHSALVVFNGVGLAWLHQMVYFSLYFFRSFLHTSFCCFKVVLFALWTRANSGYVSFQELAEPYICLYIRLVSKCINTHSLWFPKKFCSIQSTEKCK